jgi:hypothetical protein
MHTYCMHRRSITLCCEGVSPCLPASHPVGRHTQIPLTWLQQHSTLCHLCVHAIC